MLLVEQVTMEEINELFYRAPIDISDVQNSVEYCGEHVDLLAIRTRWLSIQKKVIIN
jgi:hypothetical protein